MNLLSPCIYHLQDLSKWENRVMYQGFKGISDRTNKLFRRQNERRTNSRRKQSLPVHLRTEQQPVNLFQRAGPTTQCKNGSDVESTENSVRRKYPPPKKTAPRTMPVPLTLESLKYRGWASDQKKMRCVSVWISVICLPLVEGIPA